VPHLDTIGGIWADQLKVGYGAVPTAIIEKEHHRVSILPRKHQRALRAGP
jgi:hypothetical protein